MNWHTDKNIKFEYDPETAYNKFRRSSVGAEFKWVDIEDNLTGIADSACVFVNKSNTGTQNGLRATPYKTIAQAIENTTTTKIYVVILNDPANNNYYEIDEDWKELNFENLKGIYQENCSPLPKYLLSYEITTAKTTDSVFLSNSGNDSNSGLTEALPKKTFDAALELAKAENKYIFILDGSTYSVTPFDTGTCKGIYSQTNPVLNLNVNRGISSDLTKISEGIFLFDIDMPQMKILDLESGEKIVAFITDAGLVSFIKTDSNYNILKSLLTDIQPDEQDFSDAYHPPTWDIGIIQDGTDEIGINLVFASTSKLPRVVKYDLELLITLAATTITEDNFFTTKVPYFERASGRDRGDGGLWNGKFETANLRGVLAVGYPWNAADAAWDYGNANGKYFLPTVQECQKIMQMYYNHAHTRPNWYDAGDFNFSERIASSTAAQAEKTSGGPLYWIGIRVAQKDIEAPNYTVARGVVNSEFEVHPITYYNRQVPNEYNIGDNGPTGVGWIFYKSADGYSYMEVIKQSVGYMEYGGAQVEVVNIPFTLDKFSPGVVEKMGISIGETYDDLKTPIVYSLRGAKFPGHWFYKDYHHNRFVSNSVPFNNVIFETGIVRHATINSISPIDITSLICRKLPNLTAGNLKRTFISLGYFNVENSTYRNGLYLMREHTAGFSVSYATSYRNRETKNRYQGYAILPTEDPDKHIIFLTSFNPDQSKCFLEAHEYDAALVPSGVFPSASENIFPEIENVADTFAIGTDEKSTTAISLQDNAINTIHALPDSQPLRVIYSTVSLEGIICDNDFDITGINFIKSQIFTDFIKLHDDENSLTVKNCNFTNLNNTGAEKCIAINYKSNSGGLLIDKTIFKSIDSGILTENDDIIIKNSQFSSISSAPAITVNGSGSGIVLDHNDFFTNFTSIKLINNNGNEVIKNSIFNNNVRDIESVSLVTLSKSIFNGFMLNVNLIDCKNANPLYINSDLFNLNLNLQYKVFGYIFDSPAIDLIDYTTYKRNAGSEDVSVVEYETIWKTLLLEKNIAGVHMREIPTTEILNVAMDGTPYYQNSGWTEYVDLSWETGITNTEFAKIKALMGAKSSAIKVFPAPVTEPNEYGNYVLFFNEGVEKSNSHYKLYRSGVKETLITLARKIIND